VSAGTASAGSGTAPSGSNSVTGQNRQAGVGELALPAADVQAHDEEIARYYAGHRDKVRRWLVSGCGCPEADAEDIVQDTILVIRSGYWPTVRALAKPEAYWYKIAGNRYRRTRGRQAGRTAGTDPSELLPEQAAPGDQFAQIDRRLVLEQVIGQLPRRQRQVLWLRLVVGFSEAETAEILGIGTGSVKTHLNHARTRMQKLLRLDSATWEAEIR
jgi:RNA polymerase sigma factor (sigma-70 family)